MIYIFINQATRYLFIDIINSFAEKGHNVELITGEIREGKTGINKDIKKCMLIRYDNSTSFKRIFTWVIFTFQVFLRILFRKKANIELIFVSTPPFLPFLGIFFKKYFNIPYYVIVYDIYPDVLVNFGIFRKDSYVINLWNKLNQNLYRRANKVFTISNSMAKIISSQGCEAKKLIVISNWVDSSFIKPIIKNENPFVKDNLLINKFVVIYSGNMGSTHDVETLVLVADKLKLNTSIHFLIIGDGIKKGKVERMVIEKSLDNITLLPLQPSDILPYSLTSGDLAYLTLDKGAENASVPSKLYYMLSAGCGIISASSLESELGALTKFYNFGEVFHPGDVNSISDFVLFCLNNPLKMQEFRKNARNASFDFTPDNAKQYYNAIVNV